MALPTQPTLLGYIDFIRNIMAIPDTILPDDSPYIELSYDIALEIVNMYLYMASPGIYTIAVYNLAADYLVNIAQDDPTLPPPDNTYWTDLRNSMQINSFVPGLINASQDQATSAAIMTPLSLENITLADLQTLKTPWGRTYMGIAQSVGSMWGLTL
jgi:hypothetical protein